MSLNFSDIICTPSRKPVKFTCGNFSRHSLFFDSAISREDRHLIFLEVFACAKVLLPASAALADYVLPRYSPDEYVELRVVTDHRHPVYRQTGLYAKKTIPSNTIITPYSGFIEVFGSSCNSRTYTMGFGSIGDDFALDAEFAGNYGRFANDPRGVIGLSANLIAESRFNARGEAFTALVSRRQIMEGEEILMSYGKAHSLGSSPWTNVEGEPVLRYRSSGMIPLPTFESVNVSFSQRNCIQEKKKPYSYDVMWECPQCGTWSFSGGKANTLAMCENCQAPQSAGCPFVALMSSPFFKNRKTSKNESFLKPPALSLPPTVHSSAENDNTEAVVPCKSLASPETAEGSLTYESTKVEWPLGMPFLPWQVWDPSVPISTVLKHSKFDSQEHLFLYRVTSSLAVVEERREKKDDRSISLLSKEEPAQGETRRKRKREKQPSERMWERCEMGNLTSRCTFPETGTSFTEDSSQWNGGNELIEVWDDEMIISSSRFLQNSSLCFQMSSSLSSTSPMDPSSQINRFIPLNRNPFGSPFLCTEDARTSLLQICCRLYTGRSFNRGELVGYVGGVIRNIGDTRCRPDNSPLEIPMQYFLPWRLDPEFLSETSRCRKADATQTSKKEDFLFKAKKELLKRFSRLALVVTNEMMYCPCLAVEDTKPNCTNTDVSWSETGSSQEHVENEANNPLLNNNHISGTNVTFILTVDPLGCPYVACVATVPLCAFEPLLATFL